MNDLTFPLIINAVIICIWLALFFKDKKKAIVAVSTGAKTIFSMLPFLCIIVSVIGIGSSFVDTKLMTSYLGEQSGIAGFFIVSVLSSFLQIPGIIAVPITSALYTSGVSVSIVAVFLAASTMSSIFTLPLEIKYLGKKFAYTRIGLTYILCVVVSMLMGIIVKTIGGNP